MDRFIRQTCVPGVDQDKLQSASVLVVGAGGSGSPAIMYLAGSGIKRLDVCDFDLVEESNIHRQILYTDEDIDTSKSYMASYRVAKIAGIVSDGYTNLSDVDWNRYSIVLDCTDRWDSHNEVIQSALSQGKHVVHGSIQGTLGRVIVFGPGGSCWRCLHPDNPLGRKELVRGTLGPVCGVIGSIMAMETLKIIMGLSKSSDRMITYDAANHATMSLTLTINPNCKESVHS